MTKRDLAHLISKEVLELFVGTVDELRLRQIVRSHNNPVADLAEKLCSVALNLKLTPRSTKGYDAVDAANAKYEIKARRLTTSNRSLRLGAIRNLDEHQFDFLLGVVFSPDFSVQSGHKIPHLLVLTHAARSRHVNAWVLDLRDDLLSKSQVVDITAD
jgi:hypothetical protein